MNIGHSNGAQLQPQFTTPHANVNAPHGATPSGNLSHLGPTGAPVTPDEFLIKTLPPPGTSVATWLLEHFGHGLALEMSLQQLTIWLFKLCHPPSIELLDAIAPETLIHILGQQTFNNNKQQLLELQIVSSFVAQHRVQEIPLPWDITTHFDFQGRMVGCFQ